MKATSKTAACTHARTHGHGHGHGSSTFFATSGENAVNTRATGGQAALERKRRLRTVFETHDTRTNKEETRKKTTTKIETAQTAEFRR